MPLPSKFWPSPARPDHRVEEVLVVLAARSRTRRGSRRRRSAAARRARTWTTRSVCGSSSIALSVRLREVARRPARGRARGPAARPRSSGRSPASIHGNAASIVAGVSRTPGRISRANARVGGNAALSDASAALAFSSVGASSRIEVRRLRVLGGERGHRDVEVRDEVLELRLVAHEPGGGRAGALDQPAEVLLGLGAEQRLVDLRLRARGGPGVVVGVVPATPRRSRRGRSGSASRSSAAVGSDVSAVPSPSSTSLQVLARVGLQRGEHLVELHRRRRSASP